MKRILLWLSIIPAVIYGQLKVLPVFADYAVFSASDTTAYVEVYLSIYQGNLTYRQENESFNASFTTTTTLYKEGSEYGELSHSYHNTVGDTTAINIYNQFLDIYRYELPFGVYKAKVQVIDNRSALRGEIEFPLEIERPKEEFYFSDIEFCSKITRDAAETLYLKNGLQVLPHPRRTFDALQPMLYFYTEINGLPFNESEETFYTFEYSITNVNGDTLRNKPAVKKKIYGPVMVEVSGMNVIALPKGLYYLNLAATLDGGKKSIVKRSKFYVNKKSKNAPTENKQSAVLITGVYTDMNEEDIELEFKMAKYIAGQQEIQIFKNLETKEAMAKYLAEFWARRDKAAMMSPGIYRQNYLDRAQFANEKYRYMGRDGWKSDRGRVFMIYGEPDEYERFASSMEDAPHEIWHYHSLEGGSIFIFGDIQGFGEYQLLHSTYRKELQNENWRNELRKIGQNNASSIDQF
jgi:GWxTD domain-containing protein